MVAIGAAVVQMQVATIAATFGVYFAHITTTTTLPAYLVSAVPSVMGFIMFAFCPVSTALAKVKLLCSLLDLTFSMVSIMALDLLL